MHGALQDRRAPGAQRQGADYQREHQQYGFLAVDTEDERLGGPQEHRGNRWNGQPDTGQRRAEREIQAVLQTVGARRAHGGKSFRQQHQRGDDNADHRRRRARVLHRGFNHRREHFRQQHHSDQAHHQQTAGRQRDTDARRGGMDVLVGDVGEKVVAMSHGLNEHEHPVQHQRRDAREGQLRRRQQRARAGCRVIRHHQRQYRQGRKHRQRGRGATALKVLLAMPDAAHQQANTHDPIAHDHDRGEHRVACETGFFRTGRQHHRNDESNFDHRHGHRQHQGAERFADTMRHHFRMVDRREHGSAQCDADQREQQPVTRQGIRGSQHDPGGERRGDGPAGQGGRGCGHSGFLSLRVLVACS
ncbi:hypothetical protein KCU90_g3078, partial [Aureobasidium melanogenum]